MFRAHNWRTDWAADTLASQEKAVPIVKTQPKLEKPYINNKYVENSFTNSIKQSVLLG